MATATVTARSDIHAGDWRDGVITPPEGHVFGKTALSQQEWRRLHKRPGEFVMVVSGGSRPGRLASSPKAFAAAAGDFRYVLGIGVWDYGPHGGYRLCVMAAADWQRIKKETR